jgi:hypothetical protein
MASASMQRTPAHACMPPMGPTTPRTALTPKGVCTQVQSSVSGAWDVPMFSSDLAATLRVVDFSCCSSLRSIDAVRTCVQLKSLWMPGCVNVSNLSPLAACSETLEELWIAGNAQIPGLAALKALTRLRKLDLRGCDIEYDEVEDLQQTCTHLADPPSVEVEGLVRELRPDIPRSHQKAAIGVLLAMIADEPEPQTFIATAAISPLALLLGGDSSPDVQAAASHALGLLAAKSAEYRGAIAAAGAIPSLCCCCRGQTP